MPHINLGNDAFGIMSLFEYRPEAARPLSELAEMLLRGPSTLTSGEAMVTPLVPGWMRT